MPQIKDLTGQRFNRLVAIEIVGKQKNGARKWLCVCDCGKKTIVVGSKLTFGHTKSCGCWLIDARHTAYRKHGLKNSKEYNSWCAMKQRCYYKKNKRYDQYGGRGIAVCERWKHSFVNFLEDMGNKPTDKHSIERIDVNGNYEPSNCRWATPEEQVSNKTSNVFITYRGETKTAKQWADAFGVSHVMILFRHKKGLPVDDKFFIPKTSRSKSDTTNTI